MKTLHRLLPLSVIALICLSATSAFAYSWWVTPNTQPPVPGPSDVAQLPLYVTFDFVAPYGWDTAASNNATWSAVWPRSAAGAWYRPFSYTRKSITKNPVFPYPYSCKVQGMGFVCRDLVRALDRKIGCPATIAVGPLKLWRSVYNSAWPELGLFTANNGPFSATTGRTIALTEAVVTASGKQINCSYGNRTVDGPGTTLDVWVHRR